MVIIIVTLICIHIVPKLILIMIIIIIIIKIIIIITLKGAIQDFVIISSQRCEPSPTRMLKWQHIKRLSCATCRVMSNMCHVVQRDSSSIKFDGV